jgi:hypothetical protein
MFEQPIVSFDPDSGFSLVGIDLVVDTEDFPGVHIAVENLAKDFGKVTGQGGGTKVDWKAATASTKNCILIGTLSQSPTVQLLQKSGKIDTSEINGKWESWMTICISHPFGAYDNALVIVGSDKRGAIYGAYSLSEQIGVSP